MTPLDQGKLNRLISGLRDTESEHYGVESELENIAQLSVHLPLSQLSVVTGEMFSFIAEGKGVIDI